MRFAPACESASRLCLPMGMGLDAAFMNAAKRSSYLRKFAIARCRSSPSSPRHKSFAQHLLEIEQEAAKAASRCARGPLWACRRVQEAELGSAP